MPVINVATPFGNLRMGDAFGGVCGGMVFAVIDYFLAGLNVPQERTPEMLHYFGRRLMESWAFPFGVLKYFDWQRRSNDTTTWLGTTLSTGVYDLTIQNEWPKIQATLHSGLPVPLGLVKVKSWRPKDLAKNHQALCFGYEDDEKTSAIHLQCYDPNWPEKPVVISFFRQQRKNWLIHSEEGDTIRGLFQVNYRRPRDMAQLPQLANPSAEN